MAKDTVLIIFQKIMDPNAADELDVLEQVKHVENALVELDYHTERYEFTFDVQDFINTLEQIKPRFVFNLVETVDGKSTNLFMAPAVLDNYGIKYSGCSSEALYITTNKILTKQLFRYHHIPTAKWVYKGNVDFVPHIKYIVKAVSEEASVGIHQDSVRSFECVEQLNSLLAEKKAEYGMDFFAEEFIDGREFNISLLQNGDSCDILPAAEMLFFADKKDILNIVDYKSKWDEDSKEYANSQRTFELGNEDQKLVAEIRRISKLCWDAFNLSGYVRVDLRIDEFNNPYVLEINANPCISPDGGFIAASEKLGMSYKQVVERIIEQIK